MTQNNRPIANTNTSHFKQYTACFHAPTHTHTEAQSLQPIFKLSLQVRSAASLSLCRTIYIKNQCIVSHCKYETTPTYQKDINGDANFISTLLSSLRSLMMHSCKNKNRKRGKKTLRSLESFSVWQTVLIWPYEFML